MSKTPCENVGYEAGCEFVLLSDAGPLSKGTIVKAANAGRIDGGLDVFKCRGSAFWLDPLNMQKLDADGWIEWEGGDMPVERGTLVDVKFRGGYVTLGVSAGIPSHEKGFICHSGCWSAHYWSHIGQPIDIVAYRLHKPEQQFKGMAAADVDGKLFDVKIVDGEIVSCTPSKRDQPTIDELMHAWQKAKANADTSRHILKLAEQDESSARKALDDALRAAGWGDAQQDEPLNITDWLDLQPGDIVWWKGNHKHDSGECPIILVEHLAYIGVAQFKIGCECHHGVWIDAYKDQWRFIRRPTFAAPPKNR
ncbi:hypothetical protein QMU90_002322 [Edwardsiella ictaluri]|nr:hypothetical protein [Edwardsiella ictaluri]